MQFIARIIRAAKLESCLYEEVETDKDATSQALVVVLLSSLAASIGASTYACLDRTGHGRACGVARMVCMDLFNLYNRG